MVQSIHYLDLFSISVPKCHRGNSGDFGNRFLRSLFVVFERGCVDRGRREADEERTQKAVANVARVTAVTLRNRYREQVELLDELDQSPSC